MKAIKYAISRPSATWICDIHYSDGMVLTFGDIDYESLRNEVFCKTGIDIKPLKDDKINSWG